MNMFITVTFICAFGVSSFTWAFQPSHKNEDDIFTANLLRAVVDRMSKDYTNREFADIFGSNIAIRPRLPALKNDDEEPNYSDINDEGEIIGNGVTLISTSGNGAEEDGNRGSNSNNNGDNSRMVPSLRDNEFLEHSHLWGHQFMTGGAGEGKQNLKPEGSIPNKNEIKTDAVLPAYCNPPNPCPLGFSIEDGCIQRFENTAAFSREYQSAQKCMCDTEHMFDCPASHEFSYDNDLDFDQIVRRLNAQEKDVNVKKTYPKKILNPFLQGEMLPIAAKKGLNVGF